MEFTLLQIALLEVQNSEKRHITIPEGQKIVSMSSNDRIFLQSNYTYNFIEHVKNLQNVTPLIKTDSTDSLHPNLAWDLLI